MGFNKVYLPPIEVLKERLEKEGVESLLKTYRSYDLVMGSTESVDFLDSLYKVKPLKPKNDLP